ncbi:hypothetical protein EDC01DRAFT_673254 [Geopyxis carbonaria]|nr:hypothetical protein EDC01DRAFT_673254 [Geopyxis carbonaria]
MSDSTTLVERARSPASARSDDVAISDPQPIIHDILDLGSEIFTVSVGPSRYTMNMHSKILCKSPVLRVMCTPMFLEGERKHIELPEDDANVFVLLATWLYLENFTCDDVATLGELYITASKYDLPALETMTIEKLETSLPLDDDSELRKLAQAVYPRLSLIDTAFRNFYIQRCQVLAKDTARESEGESVWWGENTHALQCIKEGGEMAVDTYKALGIESQATVIRTVIALMEELYGEQANEMNDMYDHHQILISLIEKKKYKEHRVGCKMCTYFRRYNTEIPVHIIKDELNEKIQEADISQAVLSQIEISSEDWVQRMINQNSSGRESPLRRTESVSPVRRTVSESP